VGEIAVAQAGEEAAAGRVGGSGAERAALAASRAAGVSGPPLRVCHVVPFLDRVGGYELQARALAARQRTRLGLDTLLVTHGRAGLAALEASEAGPIHRVPRGARWYHPGSFWRRHGAGVDVVHAHALHRFSGLLIARAAAAGVPALVKVASADDVEMHADPAAWNAHHAASGRRLGLARRIALRAAFARLLRAQRFVALNGAIARQLVAAGIPAARVLELPNGVDVERHRPPDADGRARARARLGIAPETCCVVCVGRLVASKDVATVLAALAKLPPGAPVELLVAGDGPERAALEQAAAEARVRARFLGQRDDVGEVFQAADLFASASRTEGMPNAVLEALATGLACALSDVPGHGDTAAGREHALFFPAGDALALAAALRRLRDDPGLRNAVAARARAAACEVFSLDVLARRYAGLYEEIGAGAARSRPGA